MKINIKNPFSQAIDSVKELGKVVDKFVRTPEEKDELMSKIEENISERWKADSQADSWLTKNIRPLLALWSASIFTIMLFTDGNIGDFKINDAYIPVYQSVFLTIIGGYFALRSYDKRGKIK